MAFNAPGVNPWAVPAAPPPPGVVPNFENPKSLNGATIGVASTLIVLNTGLVSCAIASRWRELRWKDYITILALILSFGFEGLVLFLAPWTRHQWDTPLARLDMTWNKALVASEYFLSPTIMFAKLGIFLMYLEMFKINRRTRWIIYAGIAYNFLIYLPHIGIVAALCTPGPGQPWGLEVEVKCGRTVVWGPIQGTLALFEDIYIFAIPIPILMKLNMSKNKKIGTLLIFGTALFGIAASIIGLVFRVLLWKNTKIDITWYTGSMFICMMVEDNVAIMVSVFPHVAGFFKTQAKENKPFYRLYQSTLSLVGKPRSSLGTLKKVPSPSDNDPETRAKRARADSLRFLNDPNGSCEAEIETVTLGHAPRQHGPAPVLPQDRIMKSVEMRTTQTHEEV